MASVCLLLLLFLSALPSCISLHSSSLSYYSDQEALLAFKRSLSFDPYNSLLDWSPHHSFCNWTGVVCSSRHQRVVSLNLTGMSLLGPISPFLGNLSFLRVLSLFNNIFEGQIPSQLGRLFRLRVLRLSKNELEGSIPSALARCNSLEELILCFNRLSGNIPSQLGRLSHLEKLRLGYNQLIGTIPSFIFNMSSLSVLDLAENRLHGGILVELGMISKLQALFLSRSHLTGEIPSSLSNCTQLQLLDLEENQLSGKVPLEFGNLRQLLRIYLGDNRLVSGSNNLSILTALTNCSSLQKLKLSLNYLTGVLPSSIGQMSSQLSVLRLNSNKIEGHIPSGIRNLTMLEFLDLSDNHFSGTIPSTLGQLPNLERLNLYKNNLNGSIPKSLGEAKSLGLLSLSENMLIGKIPDSLGTLPQLRVLLLHHNKLSGKIPSSLGRCQTLELVDLSHNELRGNIPREVAGLKNLQFYFNISNNLIKGSLLEMSQMMMVQAIDVSINNFSSEIPAILSSCTNLQYLNLSWNLFYGQIPTSLTKLKNLQDIDLSNNNLSGAIPMAFQEMRILQHINFSSNRLTGEVPKEGVFATIDKSAFMGNLGLCSKWHNLQPCYDSKNKKKIVSKKVIVPVLIGIVIFLMSIILSIIFYRRRHTNKNSNFDLNIGPKKFSYEELEEATGGFNQTNLLGIGSFGSIYKGILSNGTNIAIKVLNLQDKNALQTFDRECNVLKRLRHRNVIKIISACSIPDFKSLVLPFMSNGSLEKWLYPKGEDECKLNLSTRLGIAKEIAQGMAYLHHHCFVQVIHCDLKPSNVLLGDDMTPHIADFGIAKLLFGNSMDSLTTTNALKGSMGYIAPEYGLGGKVSSKGDVYSYGILLLELLTRRRPTDGMFIEGINLPKWVGMAFPNKITEVLDNNLLGDVNELDLSIVLSCLTQFIQVGLTCTRELPQQCPDMMEIVERLERIIGAFLGTQSFKFPIDILPFLESTSGLRNTNLGRDENWSTSTSWLFIPYLLAIIK